MSAVAAATVGLSPVLRVAAVAKRFGATAALSGVDLELRPGEVHAVIGENGAGKSTLMNLLAGTYRADAGEMEVNGMPYAPESPHEARRRGLALIHQELALCPHLTVAENIVLGAEPSRAGVFDRRRAESVAVRLLGEFGHSEIDPGDRVADLPLAARQVIEICRALAADARVVLMDEPTSSFQRADVERLFLLVRQLTAQGIAVLYISHFLEEVREIAQTYTVLRDGRSVDSGTIADASNESLIAQMVGRSMSGLFPPRAPRVPGDVLLHVQGLVARGVREATFELRAGEILGIAGLIGSGRTELVRAMFGLTPIVAGVITKRGRTLDRPGATPRGRIASGFGYLSEDRKREGLALPLSVTDNITATRLPAVARAGIIDRQRQRAGASALMRALGIRARTPDQSVRSLSGGNQQKVAVARLLFQDADVLLLDEPTRGIDIGSKAQVYEAIVHIAAQGKAVLLVSSYLPELFGLCDRLAVMSRGRLLPARPIGEWTPEAVMAVAI